MLLQKLVLDLFLQNLKLLFTKTVTAKHLVLLSFDLITLIMTNQVLDIMKNQHNLALPLVKRNRFLRKDMEMVLLAQVEGQLLQLNISTMDLDLELTPMMKQVL